MSDKRANLRERTQRFRRRMRGEKQGVSPVVATLILILIAVAAAAALYLWLVGWQGSVTGTIGKPGVNTGTFTLGGSTSVYPFSQLAVSQFLANNTGATISLSAGGTGAGMLAVCDGSIDVGEASSLETADGLIASDGCPSTDAASITITTVAYDAVDVIYAAADSGTASASVPGIQSINQTVLLGIYLADSSGTPTLPMPVWDHVALGLSDGSGVTWSEIPTTAGCATSGTTTAGCTLATDTNHIETVSRSDASGTTQAFEARLLGATSATATASSVSGLGFGGCGGNNLLSDCGITTNVTASGNPAVISAVAGNVNYIGYASDGLVRAAGSGVAYVDFAAPGQTCAALGGSSLVHDCGVIPSLGATGTIAAGITSSTTVPNYAGWRPFEYVTLQPIDTIGGLVESYVNWLLQPGVNTAIATEAAEVSVYSI
jgi:flagellin-like protein